MKRVAIIGTVGVPSKYGGFETLVENIIDKSNPSSIHYTVYCSSKSYTEKRREYKGAKLVYIPLKANGAQSIPYDIWSIFSALQKADILLILGVSGCIILPLIRLFSQKRIIVNIDGLEHRRNKWKPWIRKFLKWSEKIAVQYADIVIADNKAIQDYVKETYGIDSELIAYGGDHVLCTIDQQQEKDITETYQAQPETYSFGLCRIEPENNVHTILEAFAPSGQRLIFVGNWENSEYGQQLKKQYKNHPHITLLSPIYDLTVLHVLRKNCAYYIHGHSAGGTNPSLVEAMFFGKPIIAYDVSYNRETTEEKALYFSSAEELTNIIRQEHTNPETIGQAMFAIATHRYLWNTITKQYESLY